MASSRGCHLWSMSGGGAGALFREQIGCRLFDVIALDDCTDMWVDDEAIVCVDLDDREALAEVINPVATWIACGYGRRQPVFGAAVDHPSGG